MFRSTKHPSKYVKHSFLKGQGFNGKKSIITLKLGLLPIRDVVPPSGKIIGNCKNVR